MDSAVKKGTVIIGLHNLMPLLLVFTSLQLAFAQGETTDILTEVSGRQVYIAVPVKKASIAPVVMAIHGSGRGALDYFPGHPESNPFYVHQRNLAVENGFVFVVVSNGVDTWGTDKGLTGLIDVYHYIVEHFSVKKKWVLWATSAGGVQMFRMIKEHRDKVNRVVATFPVYDLLQAFEQRKRGKFVWPTAESFAAINPATYPEKLTAVPMLVFHGIDDSVVPLQAHSERLKREVNSRGGNVRLVVVSGGHSTSNWQVYQDRRIRRFIKRKE